MSDLAQLPWTIAQFLAWQSTRQERYELVDGRPVRMTAGARNKHDDIVVNLLTELRRQLRGSAVGRLPAAAA
jgi:Uma2 family endonuclease